ncbi:MAG TPA: hypothetical protein ENN73_03835 [Firmicutes bacterium]|nr:hypothetical protein [Bacillota bacterium]
MIRLIFTVIILISAVFYSGCASLFNHSSPVPVTRVTEAVFDPVQESHYLLLQGKMEYSRGNYIEASVYFQRAIGFDFYNPEPHLWLASSYYNLGWYSMASFEFDRIVFILNSSEWRGFVFYLLGRTYEKQGKLGDAYGRYKAARAEGYSTPELEQRITEFEKKYEDDSEPGTSSVLKEGEQKKLTEFEKTHEPKEFYRTIKLKP